MVTIQITGIAYDTHSSAQHVLTVAENTVVPISIELASIKDLSAKKGSTSKTVVIKGDKASNIVLGQAYDVNIESGAFDRKKRTTVVILEDGIPVMSGFMRLLSVNKLSLSNNTWDQQIEYDVSIVDETSSFYQSLGDSELTDLRFDDLNHVYSAANVIATIGNTVVDGYIYTWNLHDDGAYNLQEFHPAIYAQQYWDRIFDSAGKTYTWDSISDDNIRFDKLLVPYGGGTPKVSAFDIQQNSVIAETALTTTFPQQVNGQFLSGQSATIGGWTETNDPAALFSPVLGQYTNPFALSNPTVQLAYTFVTSYSIVLRNNSGVNILLSGLNFATTNGFTYGVRVNFLVNGVNMIPPGPSLFIAIGDDKVYTQLGVGTILTLPPGDTTIHTQVATNTGYLPAGLTILPGDVVQTKLFTNCNVSGLAALSGAIEVEVVVTDMQMTIAPTMTSVGFGQLINVENYVPKKIKQRDFLKGIMTLFNLYAQTDPDDANNIIITTRDAFYDAGVVKNWTDPDPKKSKLLLDLPSVIKFAPEMVARRLDLTYMDGKDPFNQAYQDNTRETYGELRYVFDDENVKGETTITLPFEPSPLVRTDLSNTLGFGGQGMYVNAINGLNPVTGLRLVYDGGEMNATTPYYIQNYPGSVLTQTNYAYSGHFDDPVNPTFDLNFGVCDFYFYNELELFTPNNMYNMHWRRTLGQINDGKILTAYFDLNVKDINQLQLNDKIYIKDSYWNILKVIDYDASSTRPTQVELISVDTEATFANYTRPGKPTQAERTPGVSAPVPPGSASKPTSAPTQETLKARQESKNTYESKRVNTSVGKDNFFAAGAGGNFAVGDGNLIDGNKNMVVGDNNRITGSGNMVVGSNQIVVGDDQTINEEGPWAVDGDDIRAVVVEDSVSPLVYPNILPPEDAVSDLGSATFRWKDLYVDGIIYNGYESYTCLISQTGTSAPTVVMLKPTTLEIVWSRNGAGDFDGTLTGAFPINKTWLMLGATNINISSAALRQDVNIIHIGTNFAGAGLDDILQDTPLEIRVYN